MRTARKLSPKSGHAMSQEVLRPPVPAPALSLTLPPDGREARVAHVREWWSEQRAAAPLDREVDPWGALKLREHLDKMCYIQRITQLHSLIVAVHMEGRRAVAAAPSSTEDAAEAKASLAAAFPGPAKASETNCVANLVSAEPPCCSGCVSGGTCRQIAACWCRIVLRESHSERVVGNDTKKLQIVITFTAIRCENCPFLGSAGSGPGLNGCSYQGKVSSDTARDQLGTKRDREHKPPKFDRRAEAMIPSELMTAVVLLKLL
eukprot:g4569.t1